MSNGAAGGGGGTAQVRLRRPVEAQTLKLEDEIFFSFQRKKRKANVGGGVEGLARGGRSQTCSSSAFSPFLDDDDHGSQEQDQDQEAAHAGGQDEAHVLGVLGHLQGALGVLAGGWKTPRLSQD